MGELLRRRAMMAAASGGGGDSPINPLVNGDYKGEGSGAGALGDIVVTLGSHINCYKRWGNAYWAYYIPFSEPFELAVGDVVVVKAILTQLTTQNPTIALYGESANVLSLGTMSEVNTPYTFTKTVSTAGVVTRLRTVCNGSTKTRHIVDYEMYVNDVRYV